MFRTSRYLTRMTLFMVAVLLVAAVLYPGLAAAFAANPVLNGVIVAMALVGSAYTFRSVLVLNPEITWLEGVQREREGTGPTGSPAQPELLAPMARMLGERHGQLVLSPLAMRSLLDGISARLNETREISRYFIGLLILLGLLGTFWGLLQTVAAVAGVIRGLSIEQGDLALVFGDLKAGLEAPLSGMGTAFSSSLFGLAGSLALGFLELQASQAQNRFYKELEDWLAGTARFTSSAVGDLAEAEGMGAAPAYIRAVVEQMAENLERLLRAVAAAEDERRETTDAIRAVTESLGMLNDHMRMQQSVMVRLAESQLDMAPLVQRLTQAAERGGFGLDDSSRQHLRSMEAHLARLTEHLGHHRDQLVADIRSEIKLLARTIAALAEEPTE